MTIAFLDFMGIAYAADTPRLGPLGGTQSAVCYLAEGMAARGWGVTLFNGTTAPGHSRGVTARPVDEVFHGALDGTAVVVVTGGCSAGVVEALRQRPGPRPFMVYWTGHMPDQPAAGALADPAYRGFWDGFVFVTRFQQEAYRTAFAVPADRSVVLGYAIAPPFEAAARSGVPPLSARRAAPVLAYTSTPFRGLDVLLAAFPRIRAAVPGLRLRVFSSMAVYGVAGTDDPYAELYAQARATDGVDYVGGLPQPELAEALRDVYALAYPNIFEETFCIAALEALSAGCFVASSDLGALPETLGGFGVLMKPPPDPLVHAEHFAQMMIWLLSAGAGNPEAFDARQREQIDHVLSHGTWGVRTGEWIGWLERVLASR